MPNYLRHSGYFVSREDVRWRVDILQEAEAPFSEVTDIDFDADEPLTIEWPETPKHEPLCPSSATIRVISPSDRAYEHLYSIAPAEIRVDIFREDVLFWSGSLDPEFYEEPYESASMYVVSLSFSDFGILDRIPFSLSGYPTIYDIVISALSAAGISYRAINQLNISSILDGSILALQNITVRADNFFDEEGEPKSLREVLDGVLQPLAVRMVQRSGNIYFYDLNALASIPPRQLYWMGDSSTMGVDAVYNNIRISYSTFAQTGNLLTEEPWGDAPDPDPSVFNLNSHSPRSVNGADVFSYPSDSEQWRDASNAGFSLWLKPQGDGLSVSDPARVFRIVPQLDGSDKQGIAVAWPSWVGNRGPGQTHGSVDITSVDHQQHGFNPPQLKGGSDSVANAALFATLPVSLSSVPDPDALRIRISIDVLLDAEPNPFENADSVVNLDFKEALNQWKSSGNYLFMPCAVLFRATDDGAVYCWDNSAVVSVPTAGGRVYPGQTLGSWRPWAGLPAQPPSWLAFYSADVIDGKTSSSDKTPFGDWASNRQALSPRTQFLAVSLAKADSGQTLPYPPFGAGEIWIEVLDSGWAPRAKMGFIDQNPSSELFLGFAPPSDKPGICIFPPTCWMLLSMPKLEIRKAAPFDDEIDTDDVEYAFELDPNAKEELSIDTICGSARPDVPTARGVYFSTLSGSQIATISRAGHTAPAEELLGATLYSQYAQRRTKLSGVIRLDHRHLAPYSEASQPGKSFILVGETMDCADDTSQAVFIELRPDEFTRLDS